MKDYTNLIARLRGETREIPLPTILDKEAADAIEDLLKRMLGVSDIKCPKCGCEHYPEEVTAESEEWDCHECGFQFVVEADLRPIYSVWCKTCDWGEWDNTPLAVWRYRECKVCGKVDARRNDERR